MNDPIAKTRSVAVAPSKNEIASTAAITHQAFTRAVRLSSVAMIFWFGCPAVNRLCKIQVTIEDSTNRAKTLDSTTVNFSLVLMWPLFGEKSFNRQELKHSRTQELKKNQKSRAEVRIAAFLHS